MGARGAEWEALEAAGWEFLVSQARLGRTTSYTEMNTVLARLTRVRGWRDMAPPVAGAAG